MAGEDGFTHALSRYLLTHFSANLPHLMVFVPTDRVAARVRGLLSLEMTGVLPAILPLKGNGELADLLGFEVGSVVEASAARIEIMQVLKRLGSEDDAAAGRLEAVKGERLWQRVDGLYRILDRLALHGISVSDLRRTVPVSMVGLWEAQAATLLEVTAHMERWLARRGEMLPGDAERRVLVRAAEVLQRGESGFVPVVAGVVDGIPAALEVMKVAGAQGQVLVPELGPVTDGLVEELEAALGCSVVRMDGFNAPVSEAVAETEWDEAWLAALAVKRAVDAGTTRTCVVSPSGSLLARVAGILAQWNITVRVRGETCLDHTPTGREVLARHDWGLKGGRAADWLEAMAGWDVAPDIMAAMAPLRENSAWLEAEDWRCLMALVLGETSAPKQVVTEGVVLLTPLEARLMDFDIVIAAGCVEGLWPSDTRDTWLSDAHKRALGMADSTRTARLAGTEFESVVRGGNRHIMLLRSRTVEGRETVPSRFRDGVSGVGMSGFQVVADEELGRVLAQLQHEEGGAAGALGVLVPQGKLWPKRWSASFIEAMLACPYRAMGERVLRLLPPDPLVPEVDARVGGLLAHRWLERAGKELGQVTSGTAEQAEKRLLEIGEMELRQEPPVIRAIWRAKMKKLAPVLVAQWIADNRAVVAVEKKLAHDVGGVTVTAKLDRVDAGPVIIDYKTSTPPSWSDVARGVRPQLAIEAWLMGHDEPVADVEYWQLRGYGPSPLSVTTPKDVGKLVEPVADGLAQMAATFAEGATFPAVPDMAGGGLMATGHCERCVLAGVCRRKQAGVRH